MILTTESFDQTMRDMYPLPGTRLKQYVVDLRNEAAWERETCPRFSVTEHDDNTGMTCRNSYGATQWTHLDHDSCYVCGDRHQEVKDSPVVREWIAKRAARPPIEVDETKLSDEVEPVREYRPHPFLRAK